MKRNKKLLYLLGALALLVAAAVVVTRLDFEGESATATDTGTVVFSVSEDAVTGISWTYQADTLTFSRSETVWSYDADAAFPVNTEPLEEMVDTVSEITASKTLEEPEELSQYGLTDPLCTITVTADGESHQILLGNETSMGGAIYVSIGDGNVYLVEESILSVFSYGLYDLVQTEQIPDMSDISGFQVSAQTQELKIQYLEDSGLAYSDEYVWFADGKALDTDLVEELMAYITDLSWYSCADYNAEEEALASYGLDTPTAVITVEHTVDEETASFVLEIGDYAEDSEYCYARIRGSNMVYYIDAAVSDAMLYTTENELLPDEVLAMDFEELTAVDMILDGENYHVTVTVETATDDEGNTTEAMVYYLNGVEVELDTVLTRISALVSSDYATGVTPDRKEEIRFLFYREDENYPTVELAFYQYDSSSCLTQLMGESTVLVNRSSIVSLVEEVNTLILGSESGA